MSTKTDSLAAGRGPLTRVSRDLSWFDPAPSWRRAADLVVGVARSAPSGAAAVGVPVGEKGAVPRQLGVDRATLTALGFEGKAGQALLVPRRDGADVVAIGTGTGQLSVTDVRDAAAAFARAVPKHAGAGDESARGRRRCRRGGASRRRGHRARPLPLRVAEVQRRTGPAAVTDVAVTRRTAARRGGRHRPRPDHVASRTARPRPRQLAAQSPHGNAVGSPGHRGRQGDRTRRRGVRGRPPRRARLRRSARCQRREHGAAVHDQADLPAEAVGKGQRPPRSRGQGNHVRLGRHQPQAERPDARGDEDGHVRRRRRVVVDVSARPRPAAATR